MDRAVRGEHHNDVRCEKFLEYWSDGVLCALRLTNPKLEYHVSPDCRSGFAGREKALWTLKKTLVNA